MKSELSEVLVLVANEKSAALCTNTDGITKVLRSLDPVTMCGPAYKSRDLGESARHLYACKLMMALSHSARERNSNGVVIFADAPMMEELRGVKTNFISKILIAEVVGTPAVPWGVPGRSVEISQRVNAGAGR